MEVVQWHCERRVLLNGHRSRLPLTYANPRYPRISFRLTPIPLADWAVPVMDLSRRVGRLNRRERLEDLVRVPGVPGGTTHALPGSSRTIWPSLCSSARPEIT